MELRLISPLDKVFYGEEPAEFSRPLSVMRGETASFQVAWKLPAGHWPGHIVLRAPGARIRKVMHVPVGLAAFPDADEDARKNSGLYPDLLREWDHPFRAFSDRWESAWLDVCTDTPGDHEICVQALSVEGNVLAEVCQKIHVVNTQLPPQKLIYTRWLHLDGMCRIYDLKPFTEEFYGVLEKLIRLVVSRGINMILTPIHTPPLDTRVGSERMTVQLVDVYETADGWRFDTAKLEDWFARLRSWGVEYFEMAHLFSQWGAECAPKIVSVDGKQLFGWADKSTGERYGAFVREYVTAIVAAIRRAGVEKRCFFHISDEPSEASRDTYMRCRKLVADISADFPVMDALSEYSLYKSGTVGLPIPGIDSMTEFLENDVPGLWTYYCCGQYKKVSNQFIGMPSWRNRILGWQLYKYNIVGFLQWGLNFYNSQLSDYPIDPYRICDADGAFPAGDPFQVYPGEGGVPEESIRMMVTSHAMCDLRALQLLESLKGRDAALEIVKDISFTEYPRTPDGIFDLRERVNAEIEICLQ